MPFGQTDSNCCCHPDNEPKLNGKMIQVMLSPQPKHKRAKNPHEVEETPGKVRPPVSNGKPAPVKVGIDAAEAPSTLNNPFAGLDLPAGSPVPNPETGA